MTEQQRQQQAQGGGGGAPAAGGGAPAKQSSSTGGTQSGQFTNLQSYLNANKNQQFGSQVAGKVQGDVDTAKQAQQGAADQFRGQVTSGTVNYDEGLANEAKTNASAVAGDQTKANKFQQMRDASYGGPNALTDVGEAYTRATSANQNAQKAAQASGSEEGQRALLGQYYGRPTYSRGETNLDQFLVQNDESAKPKFQQAQQQGAQLGTQFQDLQNTLAGEAGQAKATTEATKNRLNQEFLGEGGAYGQQQQMLQKQADEAKAKAQAERQRQEQQLRGGYTSDAELAGQDIYNLDLGNYLNASDPTLASAATQEQAGNYGALSQLLGQENKIFTDPSQVGTYDPGKAVSFDKARFAADRDAVAQQYQNAINEGKYTGTLHSGASGVLGENYITGSGSSKTMNLNDALKSSQDAVNALQNIKNPSKAQQNQLNAAYSNLQNLLSQQQGLQQQYGYGNKLKSTGVGPGNPLGLGVR